MSAANSTTGSIASLVDQLLAASKSFTGIPLWNTGNRDEDERFVWPVLVNGETAECNVCGTAYPNLPELRFTITLNFRQQNIWRVDWEPEGRGGEVNPILPGHPHSGETIWGPHCHPWDLNRHTVKGAQIPRLLIWRKPLPANVQGWDNTFRWFLGETNIEPPEQIPALPGRKALL